MKVEKQKKFSLNALYDLIRQRKKLDSKEKKHSYTVKLFSLGRGYICKKVKEEAREVVDSALKEGPGRTVQESADLLYHLLVLWAERGIKPEQVWKELDSRKGKSGIIEKSKRKTR